MFAGVFYLFNRIARLDNLVGDSSFTFKNRNGQAAAIAEYAKPVIKLFTIQLLGDGKLIESRFVNCSN